MFCREQGNSPAGVANGLAILSDLKPCHMLEPSTRVYRDNPQLGCIFLSIIPNLVSLRNVYFVNVTLASFEFDVLSMFPLSMIVIASICDKNKTQNDFCFQHYEINVIILT